MASKYVDVDIDLDDFSDSELSEELAHRFKQIKSGKYDNFGDIINEVKKKCNLNSDFILVKTLDDEFKIAHLAKVFNQYTSAEIESLLPNKC